MENDIIYKRNLNIVYIVLTVIVSIIFIVFTKKFSFLFITATFIAYFVYEFMNYNKIIKNENYIYLLAKCVSTKNTSFAYGVTNSRIFSFKPYKSIENPKNITVPNEHIDLQIAMTPKDVIKSNMNKKSLDFINIGDIYLLAFKLKKNEANEYVFDNSNLLFYNLYELDTKQETKEEQETLEKDNKK